MAASWCCVFNGLTCPEDEFIVLAPYFPEYKVFIEGAGAKMVLIPPEIEHFQIDFAAFEQGHPPHQGRGGEQPQQPLRRGLLPGDPGAPGGHFEKEGGRVRPPHLPHLRRALPGDRVLRAKAPWIPHLYNDTIVCYSFSKSLSLPGERLGYVLVPGKVTDLRRWVRRGGAGRSLGYVNAPSLFQQVTSLCCDLTSDLSVYEHNCKLLVSALREMGYHVAEPGGAFYLFPRSLESDDMAFSERAKQFDLLLVPGFRLRRSWPLPAGLLRPDRDD